MRCPALNPVDFIMPTAPGVSSRGFRYTSFIDSMRYVTC